RQTGNQAFTHGVRSARQHDRDSRGRFFRCRRRRSRRSNDEIDFKTNQIRCKFRQKLNTPVLVKPEGNGDILPLNPAKFVQLLPERVHEHRHPRSSPCIEEPYTKAFSRLLRLSRISKSQNETSQCYDKRSFTHQPLSLTWLAVGSYYGQMKKATVSDLKNQISRYLDSVKHGETVLV